MKKIYLKNTKRHLSIHFTKDIQDLWGKLETFLKHEKKTIKELKNMSLATIKSLYKHTFILAPSSKILVFSYGENMTLGTVLSVGNLQQFSI